LVLSIDESNIGAAAQSQEPVLQMSKVLKIARR